MDDVSEPVVACPRSVGDDRAVRLNGWLLTEGRRFATPDELLTGFAEKLVECGVPVERATVHLPQNHPQFAGQTAVWTRENGIVLSRSISRRDLFTIMYFNSPVALMHRTGEPVRRRLEGAAAETEFQVYEELVAEGITDYLLTPLMAGVRRAPGFSIATRQPGGFCDDEITLAGKIAPALGAVVDIMLQRSMTQSLLDAYVGHEAARRILQGEVVVGGGRSIEAVILFADLRGFTALAETVPRDRVLALLNDFFACVVKPVMERGGEVLKFLGDGLLAVFPLAPPADGDAEAETPPLEDGTDETVARALMAALESQKAWTACTDERRAAGLPTTPAGLALHVGSVLFGNIGTAERLDFTVIGPAVNLAARLETLCSDLGRPVLVSERFAQMCPVQLAHEGRYRLRGLAEPQDVFAPVIVHLT